MRLFKILVIEVGEYIVDVNWIEDGSIRGESFLILPYANPPTDLLIL